MLKVTRANVVGLAAAMLWVGCGSAEGAPVRAEGGPAATQAATTPAEPASAGTVAFTVDGRVKRYDSLPDGDNNYTPLSSTIRAVPSAGGREHLMITFMAIDLRKLTYPVELPLARKPGQPLDPMAAMASVGFSYIDENGREWAGSGRLRLEAFGGDGVVTGSFTGVSLPHTEKTLPSVTLADGTFRARIRRP
jgi:hypothetical protein